MPLGQDYKATMSFEDREEAWETFEGVFSEIRRDEPNILVFYGGAGIGKSALCDHIAEQLMHSLSETVCIGRLSFSGFSELSSFTHDEALAELRLSIGKNKRIALPAFDTGYIAYLRKKYPYLSVKAVKSWLSANNSILQKALEKVPDWVEGLTTGDTHLGGMGGLGLQILNWLGQKGYDIWAHRVRDTLQLLYGKDGELTSAAGIRDVLPRLLAEDLAKYTRDHKDQRIVLLIDEYERLWPGEPAGCRSSAIDDALEVLARNSDGVLFVFFSRYPLHWSGNRKWKPLLKGRQYRLDGLPIDAAEQILKKEEYPVIEPTIRDAMIKYSLCEGKVYPFFLELQIKHYVELKRDEGITPELEHFCTDAEDFDSRREELIGRFLRGYGVNIQTSLRYLSVPRWFDSDIFQAIDKKFPLGGIPTFDAVKTLSCVENTADGKLCFAPAIWRDAIAVGLDDEIKRQIQIVLFKHFDAHAKAPSARLISDSHCKAVSEAAYFLAQTDPENFEAWRTERLAPFEEAARVDAVVLVMQVAVRLAKEREKLGTYAYTGPQLRYAQALVQTGSLREAQQAYEDLVESLNGVAADSSDESALLACALSDLADLYISSDELDTVGSLIDQAEVLAFSGDKPRISPLYAAEVRRAQGNLAVARDQFMAAENYRRTYFKICTQNAGENSLESHTALHELAKALCTLGRFDEAEAALMRCTVWFSDNYADGHPYKRIVMTNLAELFRDQGRTRAALALIEEAMKNHDRIPLLALSPSTAHMRMRYAKILRDYGCLDKAELYYRTELDAKNALLAEGNLLRCVALADLATVLAMQGKDEEAESTYRDVLILLKQHTNVPKSKLGSIKFRFSELLMRKGSYGEAEQMLDDALAALMETFGPDHYRVARCLRKYLDLRVAQGRQEDLEALQIRIDEIYRASGFNVRLKNREWERVDDPATYGLLDRICIGPLTADDLGEVVVERCALDDLYTSRTQLLRFSFADSEPPAHKYALHAGEAFFLLDGAGTPMHGLNAKASPNIDDNSILKYLQLFCEVLVGEHGHKFILTECSDEIDWRADAPRETKASVAAHLFRSEVSSEAAGEDGERRFWRVRACVIYGNGLFHAVFRIAKNGIVEMIEDTSVVKDLPVATFMRWPAGITSTQVG